MLSKNLILAVLLVASASGAGREVGVVKQVEAAAGEIVVTLDGGSERRIAVASGAAVLRIAPGETNLSRAAKIGLADIMPGDRVLVRTDGSIVITSRAELTSRHTADRAEWRSRGLIGSVLRVETATREVEVHAPGLGQPGIVRLRVPPDALQLRYRPGSARFADAVPAELTDINPGDQIHTLAEKTSDSGVLIVRKLITGYFHNFAAVVTAVDPAGGNVTVRDLENSKSIVVRIAPETALRRVTQNAAEQLTSLGNTELGSNKESRPADIRSILESLPAVELRALRSGAAVIVASAEKGDRITALTVLSGVEPLLQEADAAEGMGEWDLSLEPEEQ